MRKRMRVLVLCLLLASAMVAQDTDHATSAPEQAAPPGNDGNETAPPPPPCQAFSLRPSNSAQRWIIAHRGASAHLPEHTLAAYRLAMELGANWVEPDLLPTSDGHLIAMHTLDLNVTTNVADVYGGNDKDDRQWFSPYANRSSWWVFNFTLEELQQNLTVVQRLPGARTTLYDGLLGIPSLQDILQLVNWWNTHDLPLWSTVMSRGSAAVGATDQDSGVDDAWQPVGIYAELKDTTWLQQDAGIDLVDAMYRHFDTYRDDWELLWNTTKHRCERTEGQVPPLVLQCFDAPPLADFHSRWSSHDFAKIVGEPPYVLLVSQPACWDEDFWFALGDDDRGFLSGVGPDKACLLHEDQREAVREKAQEYRLSLHPWTERPEATYVETSPSPFATMEDELRYLFCDMKVPGLFTESVATAVQVAAMGCDSYNFNGTLASGGEPPAPDNAGPDRNRTFESVIPAKAPAAAASSVCSTTAASGTSPSLAVAGVAAFAAGVAATLLAVALWDRRRPRTISRRQQQQPYHVSSLNEDDFNDLNLT